jgi:hypothetical protein
MNYINRLSIFLLLILATGLLSEINGQRQSYDEIIRSLDELTNEQAFSRLFQYQNQNPRFANTYIQIGNLFEKMAGELDMLRQYHLVGSHIDNAILYYGLFKYFLESNEVRRNRVLYANIPLAAAGYSFTNEDILEYVESRLTHNKNLKNKLTTIYKALERSKDHYNNCVRIFNEISNGYDSYNDALLRTDEILLSRLDQLEQEYESTIKEFEKYKSLISDFPAAGYNQEFKTVPVKTFRLDGITNSDFLMDRFHIWDYGTWVSQFRNIYVNDILPLRREIEEIQNTFIANNQFLSQTPYVDAEASLNSFDELFLFRLGRFDNNSLIRELFNYSDKRQSYLLLAKNPLNNPNDSSLLMMARKLRYYYRLALQLNDAGRELDNFNNAITSGRVARFSDFFNYYYQGENALTDFTVNQQLWLRYIFNQALSNLESWFNNESIVKSSLHPAEGRTGTLVPLYPLSEDEIPQHEHVTCAVDYYQGMPAFITGYIRKPGKNMPFVAKISDGSKVEWIREIEVTEGIADNRSIAGRKVFAYENGAIALISASFDNDQGFEGFNAERCLNILVHLDNDGNILFKRSIEATGFPVYLNYDEINQLSHIVLGKKEGSSSGLFSGISVCQADSTGKMLWETTMNVDGDFAGMVRAEDKYVIYLNFKKYDIGGNYRITGNSGKNWALLISEISFDGKLIDITPVISDHSFYVDRVFSISSNVVNLLGYKGEPGDRSDGLQYFILSTEGDMIFSSTSF